MPVTRVSEKVVELLKEIVSLTGESRQEVLLKALEAYKRQRFLEQANAAFAVLKANSEEWKTEQEERRVWDVTLNDGLER